MEDGLKRRYDNPTRRGVVAGLGAAAILAGSVSNSAEAASKLSLVADELVAFTPNEKLAVHKILDRAVSTNDKVGHLLFWNIQNGALARNYCKFVILHRFQDRPVSYTDKEIVDERNKILQSDDFKNALTEGLRREKIVDPIGAIPNPQEVIRVRYNASSDGHIIQFAYLYGGFQTQSSVW